MKRLQKIGITAVVLLAGLATMVSAGFVDQEDIDQVEAATVLSAISVMEGDPDGTFRPDDAVTRAEMAKLLVVLTQNDQAEASDFADCQGHWAEGYIATATELEFVAGDGDGTFRPEDSVTGYEGAKMMLVALGYDSAAYLGATWAEGVEEDCQTANLLAHVETLDLAETLTRQEAAAMLLGTLESTAVGTSNALYQIHFPALTRVVTSGYTWYLGSDAIFTTVEETQEEEEVEDVQIETDDMIFIHGGNTGTIAIDGDVYYVYSAYLNGEVYAGEIKSKNNYQGADATIFYGGYYNGDGEFVIQKTCKTVNADNETVVNQAYLTLTSVVDDRWLAFGGGGGVFAGSVEFNGDDAKVCDLTDNGLSSVKKLSAALDAGDTIEVAVIGNSKTDTVQYIYVINYTPAP